MSYSWPGNIRELENLIRRLAALYPQEVIGEALVDSELGMDSSSLPASPRPLAASSVGGASTSTLNGGPEESSLSLSVEHHLARIFREFGDQLPPPGLYHRILREVEYPLISVALAATRGNQIKAAELLGLNRNTLRKKVRDLDVRLMRTSR